MVMDNVEVEVDDVADCFQTSCGNKGGNDYVHTNKHTQRESAAGDLCVVDRDGFRVNNRKVNVGAATRIGSHLVCSPQRNRGYNHRQERMQRA